MGDLLPYVPIAAALSNRGHSVTIACPTHLTQFVTSFNIQCIAIPPDLTSFVENRAVQQRAMHRRSGSEYIVRHLLIPQLRASYKALLNVCCGADLIVGHFLAFSVPLVADTLRLPWLQVYLHPTNLMSKTDPPILPVPGSGLLRRLGPFPCAAVFEGLKWLSTNWVRPINDLRRELHLPQDGRHPLLEPWSPYGTMAWFPKVLFQDQPEWPPKTEVMGYPFAASSPTVPTRQLELLEFAKTKRPIVFTLGTSAVLDPKDFFHASAEAAARIGHPALLIGADEEDYNIPRLTGLDIRATPYLPYGDVFPHAALVVHHGGIGSVAHSLRAGRQMLVVPFAWDQPDNAERIRRLGVGLVLSRRCYKTERVATYLKRLLDDHSGSEIARRLREQIETERPVERACDFIEEAARAGPLANT